MKVRPKKTPAIDRGQAVSDRCRPRAGNHQCEEPGASATPSARRRAGMEMLDAGSSVTEVAEALGVDSRTVRRWKHRATADRVFRPELPVAGRPRLTAKQLARLFVAFGVKRPFHVGLPGCSWTTAGFRAYSRREFPGAAEGYMCNQTLRKFLKANGCVWKYACWVRVDR